MKLNTGKLDIMQPCTKDHVPILNFVAIIYLIAIGVQALIR